MAARHRNKGPGRKTKGFPGFLARAQSVSSISSVSLAVCYACSGPFRDLGFANFFVMVAFHL